jgi:CRISPR system Cascade subunit CasD
VLLDFHTAGGGGLGGVPVAKGGSRRTVVTRRIYLQDAAFLVGLEGERSLLEEINDALRAPQWPLGLGRRSCPPIPPVHAPSGPADGGLEATLRTTPSPWQERLVRRTRSGARAARVELIIEDPSGEETAFDQPLANSFATRVFAPRRLRRESVTIPVEEAA